MKTHAQNPLEPLRLLYGSDSADCCAVCGQAIASSYQLSNRGTDVCEAHSSSDKREDER